MAEQVLWSVEDLSYTIGFQTIFNHTAMSISAGEKVALIGRNGVGKSTLFQIISGKLQVGGAVISQAKNLRIAILPQDFTLPEEATVRECVQEGQKYFYDLLKRYESSNIPPAEHERIEHILTLQESWHPESFLNEILQKLYLFRPDARIRELSGGEKRRVALAKAIVSKPDLLLLDEPTNHLDIETVGWIEEFLADYRGTALIITHDRYFLDHVASRIIELDNGIFYSVEGSYADFLAFKAERENNEDLMEEKRKHFLRSEIEWVRRSPKARLRRDQGRLKRYYEIADQKGPVRMGNVELVIPRGTPFGNRCIELENLSKSIAGKELIKNLSWEIPPGRKTGIIGANGAGKTTLLKLITGELLPDSGEIKRAPMVEFNYIDQNRCIMNEENTIYDEVAEGKSSVNLGGESISTRSYLKRFLFDDARINTQIKYLSGGEKARLTLAKVLKYGGNFLVMDEPTNDLDLSTLRLLEEALHDYPGTLLLVSHDRYFLNRVCDGILSLDGKGNIEYTYGDYDYYIQKKQEKLARLQASAPQEKPKSQLPKFSPPPAAPEPRKKKLTFKEQFELKDLETKIGETEKRIAELEEMFQDPEFFSRHGKESKALNEELTHLRTELDKDSDRYLELLERT